MKLHGDHEYALNNIISCYYILRLKQDTVKEWECTEAYKLLDKYQFILLLRIVYSMALGRSPYLY